ncbi:hypothetical protein KP004_05540 [Geomonas oryzisoli]|uniref:Uncharacterized protein n=1 Tax=Geomonas oryzisoli TaxID=2847992 RepID=A0ABX8JBY0_9BACT|nr:hypothetical protein [Geomonas oryzisoli]QWV94646.1 hypothetical protein KP004_05540 [Geomonas oryzisoli]
MKKGAMKGLATAVMATALLAAQAYASTGSDTVEQGRRPPQEAFDACRGKSAGATVTMTTPRGDAIEAVCREIGGAMVAVPERGPAGPPPGDCGDGHAPPPPDCGPGPMPGDDRQQ